MRKIVFVSIILSVAGTLTACSGSRPDHLGGINTALLPCPETPNCVNSQSEGLHTIEPILLKQGDNLVSIKNIIFEDPHATLIVDEPNYLYAEYTSRWFKFIDDLELLTTEGSHTVHIRSASRLGRSDFGVNRERIELLRAAYSKGKKQ